MRGYMLYVYHMCALGKGGPEQVRAMGRLLARMRARTLRRKSRSTANTTSTCRACERKSVSASVCVRAWSLSAFVCVACMRAHKGTHACTGTNARTHPLTHTKAFCVCACVRARVRPGVQA